MDRQCGPARSSPTEATVNGAPTRKSAMRFLIVGIIGILITGVLSYFAHHARRKTPATRISDLAPPTWINLLYFGSFACAVYGLVIIIQ
jgi:hypothetical protein